MLRSGVGLAAVMKLPGHTSSDMTMRYIDVALSDLQREYLLARSQPRHLVPWRPSACNSPTGVISVGGVRGSREHPDLLLGNTRHPQVMQPGCQGVLSMVLEAQEDAR
jgi:hypothetical protein